MDKSTKKRFYRNQTSFYEQAIYYYIRMFFPDAVNRCVFDYDIEADIFIPSVHCVIEYDGRFWHKDKADRDNNKNHYFNENGITVIRVRDSGLPPLESFIGTTFIHKSGVSEKKAFHTDEIIEQIIHYLSSMVEDVSARDKLRDYRLSHDQFLRDCPDINGSLYTNSVDHSLAEMKGIEAWDYEKNKSLKPTNITRNYPQNVFFKCKAGKSQYCSPSLWFSEKDEKNPIWYSRYCPYLIYCKDNCQFKEDFVTDYLEGRIQIENDSITSIRCMLADSACTRNAINKRFELENNPDLVQRFEALFILKKGHPEFLGRTLTCLSSTENLALIKKLHCSYQGIYVQLSANSFDESTELMEAFIAYYQWLNDSSREGSIEYYLIASAFCRSFRDSIIDKTLSKQFAHLLAEFIKKNPEEFKYETSALEELKQYLGE